MPELPRVPIRAVAYPTDRSEEVIPGKTYRQVGVRLWGVGAYEREALDGADTQYRALSRMETGDIVVNKIWARNGSVAVIPSELAGCYGSGEFPTFAPDKTELDPRWFHWITKTKWFWEQCDEKSQGTSGKNRIRPERFLEICIPLPPLPEQQRIIARIEALARRVEEARGLRREATGEREALLSVIVSNLELSETVWSTVRAAVLNKKGSVRSGPFGSQLHHEEFVESGIPAIGTRDVQVNSFNLNSGWFVTTEKFEQVRRYQVFPGDVLGTIVGGSIGRFCVVPHDVPLAFTTKHVQALTIDGRVAEPKFVTYLLNFHSRCRASLFSQVEGSAQPSLNAQKILSTELPLPSLNKQYQSLAYLDGIQAKIGNIQDLHAQTQAEIDALMPAILAKAFAGHL